MQERFCEKKEYINKKQGGRSEDYYLLPDDKGVICLTQKDEEDPEISGVMYFENEREYKRWTGNIEEE